MKVARARPATREDPDERYVVACAARTDAAMEGVVAPRLGIGDDGAITADGTVVTVDTMVEGVHWDDRLSPADVGFKLVAVNVSDLDAMGARPVWGTLALSLPAPLSRPWVRAFYRGMGAAMKRWPFRLVGGDTTRSNAGTVATLTLAGTAVSPVLRSGGRPGDLVLVTGALGLAAEALSTGTPRRSALAHLRRPPIPAPLGALLAEAGLVTAMIDLSDGLARDLGRLCRASGCGAKIASASLPTDRPLAQAVAFGEDYGLLVAADPGDAGAVAALATEHGVSIRVVGVLTAARAVRLDGGPWPAPGFDHFDRA